MASKAIALEDNICPICLYIFIQPVTMPCEHELCLTCFKQNVEEANFCCPLCRTRISTWARRASRKNALVNQKRWDEIQFHFPDKVKNRLEGVDEEDDDEIQALNVSIKLAEPGEIRNEYEEQLKKLREQRAEERQREQEASEKLIQQLQEEENKKRKELEKIEKEDEVLARELSEVCSTSESRTRSAITMSDSRSNSASMESFLDKIREENDDSKSPYPYRCLTPLDSGAGKLCVDKDKVLIMEETFQRRKIRRDKNLITTQDVASLEDSFRQNRSLVKSNTDVIDIDCLHRASELSHTLTLTNVMSSASLNQDEILNQMSEDLVVNIGLIEAGDDNSMITIPPGSPPTVSRADTSGSDRVDTAESNSRSESAQSNDSITVELNHFRPIRSCPLTPPRKLASGKVVEPQLIRTTPRNWSKTGLGSPMETNLSDIDAGSPIMQRRLSELAEERKDQVVRMSKSTSTGISARDDNENRNPHESVTHQSPRLSIRFSNTSRNVEFKDISNSPLHKRKFDFCDDAGDDAKAKRKLLIPLEPDLTENDVIITDPADFKTSPNESKNQRQMSINKDIKEKLSRSRRGKSDRVRYIMDDSRVTSPQPSIVQWIKRSDKIDACVNRRQNNDGLMVNGRDEVYGTSALENKKEKKLRLGSPNHQTRGSIDTFLSPQNSCSEGSLPKNKRARRMLRKADYVYNDPIKCNSDGIEANNSIDIKCLRFPKLGKSKNVESNDSSRDGFCSDGGSESSDDFLVASPKKIRKNDIEIASTCDHSRKRGNQLKTEKPFKSKAVLKKSKQTLKEQKLCKGGSSGKQKHPKTIHDYFTSSNESTQSLKHVQNRVVAMDGCNSDQEEKDRLMAMELQKQFQLEEKLHLNSLRFKGSKDEYSFRRNRKQRSVIDA